LATSEKQRWRSLGRLLFTLAVVGVSAAGRAQEKQFQVEEASITAIQSAIQSGQTSCRQVVQAYIDRAKAYNGVCTALVTKDGAPIPPATGMMRAGSPLRYPTQTVAASIVFPDGDQYAGPPLELGRMVTSVSDPSVQLQYGLRVGIPEVGQLNALETLNIRGERSITCKGDFDRAPSAGPLPAGAPAICEAFRKQPDALERAEELDKRYGRKPDLNKLPLYCSVMAIKNWYDTKDMRGTGGNDVNFAMDVPKADSPDVALMRSKGAVIYAVASAESVSGPAAAGPTKSKLAFPAGDLQYSTWSGHACNPYDTARTPRGSSNGSGVSVSANLATCSICEQTSGSCKGPASRNGVVSLLTTKGILQDGGWSTNVGDRAGIQCKSVKDATLILDAIKGYEKEDSFTALPNGIIPEKPYASFLVSDAAVKEKPLRGVRVAVVREFMVKHTKNDAGISDQIDKEVKSVLRDKLGAEIVESVDPLYPDDPSVPNMTYTFADAFAEILPHNVPEFFLQKTAEGELVFAVPGWDVTSIDYDVALQLHKAPLSPKINLRTIGEQRYANPSGLSDMNTYLAARADARVKDWASFVANASFKSDDARIRAQGAIEQKEVRASASTLNYLQMQSVMRLVILKVMKENHIDVFVNPEQTTPPYLLGGAIEPEVGNRPSRSCCQILTALIGAPEIEVPAGFTTTTYDPRTVLSANKTEYTYVTGEVKSMLPHPMPISMMFWSGPGYDAGVIRVASAYESATHHRSPPPAFGPVTHAAQSGKPIISETPVPETPPQ
jgi:amidase